MRRYLPSVKKIAEAVTFNIKLEASLLTRIDNWRFKYRMPSRSEAVRRLIMLGLKAKPDADEESSRESR